MAPDSAMAQRPGKIPGIDHFDPSWASRVPLPRLRHLVKQPAKIGGLWVLWLYAQIILGLVEIVLIAGWAVLIVVLSVADAMFG